MIEVNLVPTCFIVLGIVGLMSIWLYLRIKDAKKRQENLNRLMTMWIE